MFREDRYKGSLKSILIAEHILGMCPWLWAFEHIWAEGICSQAGSFHTLTLEVLNQKLDKNDGHVDIFFYMEKDGIRSVHRVPQDEILNKDFKMVHNPSADGETIAERVFSAMHLPRERVTEKLLCGKIYIPHLVIRTPGPVDRSEHYYIYTAPGNIAPNTIPLILEAAGEFVPKHSRKSATVATPVS
jgi:hypothetical protein